MVGSSEDADKAAVSSEKLYKALKFLNEASEDQVQKSVELWKQFGHLEEGTNEWSDAVTHLSEEQRTLLQHGSQLTDYFSESSSKLTELYDSGARISDIFGEMGHIFGDLSSIAQAFGMETSDLIERMAAYEEVLADANARQKSMYMSLIDLREEPARLAHQLSLLAEDVQWLSDTGATSEEILNILGSAFEELATAAEKWGVTLPPIIQYFLELGRVVPVVDDILDELMNTIKGLGISFGMAGDMLEAFASGFLSWGDRVNKAHTDAHSLFGAIQAFYAETQSRGIPTMEAQSMAWSVFGEEIMRSHNRFVELHEDVPWFIKQMVEYGVATGAVKYDLLGMAQAADIAKVALTALQEAQARGAAQGVEFIQSAATLAASIEAFGKVVLENRGLLDPETGALTGSSTDILEVQIAVWNKFGSQIIQTALAYKEFGLTIPPALQNMLNFALAQKLITAQDLELRNGLSDTAGAIGDLGRAFGDLGASVEKALTPLEKFVQFEKDIIGQQELSRLSAFTQNPAFTSAADMSAILQQILGLNQDRADTLLKEAQRQFGSAAVTGAIELLRRREFDTFADALGAMIDIRSLGIQPPSSGDFQAPQIFHFQMNVSTLDSDSFQDGFMEEKFLPAFIRALENRLDGGRISELLIELRD